MDKRIEDYALLGDCRSAALVSKAGSVNWLCFPRFDSPACFAALVDTDDNGYWSLALTGRYESERAYVADTMVLETVYHTEGGAVAVTDALVPLGRTHRLIRVVEGRAVWCRCAWN